MTIGRVALGAALVAGLLSGCAEHEDRLPIRNAATAPAPTPTPITVTPTPFKPKKLDKKALGKDLGKYLDGRASGAGIMVVDRTTGQSYAFRADGEYVTASASKLDILMTLLLKRQKAKDGLSASEKYDAGIMIKESDNKAADRMFIRAGTAGGVNGTNRRSFGMKATEAIDASCLDLLCWSLTRTTPRDQVRLMEHLFKGPLKEEHRDFVLDLMSKVQKDQRWGMSAGALKGDKIYNKNGWMTHQRDGDRWAVNSIGRIEGHGHDLLIAVMTKHNPSLGYGITTAEHLVKGVADAFRETTPMST